jgi:ferritin-like metal-binding protein YciE
MAELDKLFEDMLKDVYYAEKKIYKSLPKMIKAASDDELVAGFERHRDETEEQIVRLERVFEMLDIPARGKKCPAIDGILEEGADLIEEHDRGAGLDAALAASAQAVEHYEIARYGTLCSWAVVLGHEDVKLILGETLNEEENTDKSLSKLALGKLNVAALNGDDRESDAGKKSSDTSKRSAAMKSKSDDDGRGAGAMHERPKTKAKA